MFEFIKKMLRRQEQENIPYLQEELSRSDFDKYGYGIWLGIKGQEFFLEELKEAYTTFDQQGRSQEQEASNTNIVFVLTPKSKGFVWTWDEAAVINKHDPQYFFDYLKDQILTLNYKAYMSDVRQYVREKHVERIERHYLKPRFSLAAFAAGEKVNQLYGNITIEHLIHDEEPISLKLVCQPYTDHKYEEAKGFSELMKTILK